MLKTNYTTLEGTKDNLFSEVRFGVLVKDTTQSALEVYFDKLWQTFYSLTNIFTNRQSTYKRRRSSRDNNYFLHNSRNFRSDKVRDTNK